MTLFWIVPIDLTMEAIRVEIVVAATDKEVILAIVLLSIVPFW